MTLLYAHPYDISAQGFLFNSPEQYDEQVKRVKSDFGGQVEEFEIQFIDGEDIDCELAQAFSLNQATFRTFFDVVENWSVHQKILYIIAVGECGYAFDEEKENPEDLDIELHEVEDLKELAQRFVDEGLFGDIPERLQFYLDYDAIARDLGFDYSETTINGTNYVYRCA
jgi:antirestriction protein